MGLALTTIVLLALDGLVVLNPEVRSMLEVAGTIGVWWVPGAPRNHYDVTLPGHDTGGRDG